MLYGIAGIGVEGVTICHPLVLSVVFLPIFGFFRSGKLVGGFADFLHGLNIRAHGFHLLVRRI
jgi:hypothetical protein